MTLPNFDWTDKESLRWFILSPTGHEGPYSLNQLHRLREQNKLSSNVLIWAEGLPESLPFKDVSEEAVKEVTELPPLPETDVDMMDEIPPIPYDALKADDGPVKEDQNQKKKRNTYARALVIALILAMVLLVSWIFLGRQESLVLRRHPKMSMKLLDRILSENNFSSWDRKIFFKEYLPQDHEQIWLVTPSFQDCTVAASFTSLEGKLLSMEDEKVSFKSRGHLSDHVVEFSSFDFTSGNKIVPGLYEMDVRASDCAWGSLAAKIMNGFLPPEKEYVGRMKVVLFSQGNIEFQSVLDKLLRKKTESKLRKASQDELFWQDLQQKFETLQAITLQIEQLVLDLVRNPPSEFQKNLKPMIDEYTRKYGSFLSSFVIDNEGYFKSLKGEKKGSSQKRNYELLIRLTSKKIGLESMRLIEEFQGLKKSPAEADLKNYEERIKKIYLGIKTEIGRKISQVSSDRSR